MPGYLIQKVKRNVHHVCKCEKSHEAPSITRTARVFIYGNNSLKINFTGIPLTLHGRPSSRSSQRSSNAGPLSCAFTRRPSSGGSRGPLVPTSRAGAARAAAILLISCHLQATKDGNKHRRTLSDVAEGSTDGPGRRSRLSLSLSLFFFLSFSTSLLLFEYLTFCRIRMNTRPITLLDIRLGLTYRSTLLDNRNSVYIYIYAV